MSPDFTAALTKFSDASRALELAARENRLTEDVIRAAVDAAGDARVAFERVLVASFERVAKARGGG